VDNRDAEVSIPLDWTLVDLLGQVGQRMAAMGGHRAGGPPNMNQDIMRQMVIPQLVYSIPPLRHLLKTAEVISGTPAAAQLAYFMAQWSAAAMTYAWITDADTIASAADDMCVAHPDLGTVLAGGYPTVAQLNTFVRRMVSRMAEHTRGAGNLQLERSPQDKRRLTLTIATCGIANLSAIGHLGCDAVKMVTQWGTPIHIQSRFGPRPSIYTASYTPRWPSSN